MIVFYTKCNVIEDLTIKKLLLLAFEVVKGMRNVPSDFKDIKWDGSESGEWISGRNILTFEIDKESDMVAFRVAIVDENDELWTQDIALNCVEHVIQFRLTREKRMISAKYNENFFLPYLFKKIIRDGFGGVDADLPINDKPIYIDNDNIKLITDVIVGEAKKYSLPIIYVSHPFFKEEYDIDVVELAKDMMGSAHVLVERRTDISKNIKQLTDGKNAYNGAVDVFYTDAKLRYIKGLDITINQFRYKITHSIYTRMAMRNIDDVSSLSTIRLKNKIKRVKNNVQNNELSLKIDELQEKYKECKELFDYASEEVKKYEKRINELENDNYDLRNKVDALKVSLDNKNRNEVKGVCFSYTENQLYDDEIKRIIIECIKSSISLYGDDEKKRRDYHVLIDIVNNNNYSDVGNNIRQKMLDIFKKNKMSKMDISELKGMGFYIENSAHDKYIFKGDDRYIITVSNSPSDGRGGENLAHVAINLIFGRY